MPKKITTEPYPLEELRRARIENVWLTARQCISSEVLDNAKLEVFQDHVLAGFAIYFKRSLLKFEMSKDKKTLEEQVPETWFQHLLGWLKYSSKLPLWIKTRIHPRYRIIEISVTQAVYNKICPHINLPNNRNDHFDWLSQSAPKDHFENPEFLSLSFFANLLRYLQELEYFFGMEPRFDQARHEKFRKDLTEFLS